MTGISSQQLMDLAYAADDCLAGIDNILRSIRETHLDAKMGRISYEQAFGAVVAAAALYIPDIRAIGLVHSAITHGTMRASHNAYNQRYRARRAGKLPENDKHEPAISRKDAREYMRAQAPSSFAESILVQKLPGAPDLTREQIAARLASGESTDPIEVYKREQEAIARANELLEPGKPKLYEGGEVKIIPSETILQPEDLKEGLFDVESDPEPNTAPTPKPEPKP